MKKIVFRTFSSTKTSTTLFRDTLFEPILIKRRKVLIQLVKRGLVRSDFTSDFVSWHKWLQTCTFTTLRSYRDLFSLQAESLYVRPRSRYKQSDSMFGSVWRYRLAACTKKSLLNLKEQVFCLLLTNYLPKIIQPTVNSPSTLSVSNVVVDRMRGEIENVGKG